jgi:glycosyltransferase involved in cell wall biosynthesis
VEIHQILPTISTGDAIGNEVLEIKRALNEWGYKSEIYAQNIHPKVNAKKYKDYRKVSSEDNILIFHFSIGSEVSDFVSSLPDRKIMIYHNVTPPEYFSGVNELLVKLLKNARNEIQSLVGHVDLAVGDSEFNQLELQEMGFKNTDVLPIILDFEKLSSPNNKLIQKFDDDYVNIIFVGKLAPHKKQDDVLKIYYYYKRINPRSRLFLVGGYEGCESYYNYLQELIQYLELEDVHLTGKVDFHDLISYYQLADFFVCMSEHEGFCVPIIESMYFGIPIIAFNSTAIPYTLKGTGILVNKKKYNEIAELIHILNENDRIRKSIIKKQNSRLNYFTKESTLEKLREIISKIHDNES